MTESINQDFGHIDLGLFGPFPPWRGVAEPGFIPNFLGVRTRARHFGAQDRTDHRRPFAATYPPLDDEYFEWIDLLQAVRSAEDTFSMVELGAGWGRWMVNGAFAAKALGLDFLVVGVEAEPTHFRWLEQHLEDNGIPGASKSPAQLFGGPSSREPGRRAARGRRGVLCASAEAAGCPVVRSEGPSGRAGAPAAPAPPS